MRTNRFDDIKKYITSTIFSQSYVSSAVTASVIILVLLIVLQENPPSPIYSITIIAWTVLCINALRVFSTMIGKSIEEKRAKGLKVVKHCTPHMIRFFKRQVCG